MWLFSVWLPRIEAGGFSPLAPPPVLCYNIPMQNRLYDGDNPTKQMQGEAKAVGLYSHALMQRSYDKIQIVTLQDVIENEKRLETPMSLEVLRKAQAVTPDTQLQLLDTEVE